MMTSISDDNAFALPVQLTAYHYDQLNRITQLDAYQDPMAYSSNIWTNYTAMQAYHSEFSYDGNGNLMELLRNGDAANIAMDNLAYTYPAIPGQRSNRLDHVADPLGQVIVDVDLDGQSTGNYTYDKIGNLVSDATEDIDEIVWDVRGKIREIIRTPSSQKPDLEFRYGPMGNRMLKIVKPKKVTGVRLNEESWTFTYYLRDAQGNVLAVYTKTYADYMDWYTANHPADEWPAPKAGQYLESFRLSELHIYGSDRLGMYTTDDTVGAAVVEGLTYNSGGWFDPKNYVHTIDEPSLSKLRIPIYIQTDEHFDDGYKIFYRDYKYGLKRYELKNHLVVCQTLIFG